VGLVLWIDQNTFATGLLEKIFKKKNMAFYTIPSAQDFVYLVEDLRPSVIVLDVQTALESLDALKAQYHDSESLKALPFVFIDNVNELDFIQNKKGQITRPFDPFHIPEILETIFKAN
jgi:DNA-binding NtrC family response regulator